MRKAIKEFIKRKLCKGKCISKRKSGAEVAQQVLGGKVQELKLRAMKTWKPSSVVRLTI